MINVGIIGGAGYTAGELIRILIHHPHVAKLYVQSSSNDGNPVASIHKDLLGDIDLNFQEVDYDNVSVVFLCSGHGKSKEYLEKTSMPEHVKIVDLSHDYRLKTTANGFVYGLPELNRKTIQQATKIANPGCFATNIELALLPLATAQLLEDEVHVTAITGSTGAGYAPTMTSHFSWKNNNVAPYKVFTHQHLGEITESVIQAQENFSYAINFVPIRGNFSRGILSTVYTKSGLSEEALNDLYQKYYAAHPFVHVTNQMPDVKQVVNTNKCVLYITKHSDKVFIVSIIDNLLKGASGQAVQNMNLMLGFAEDAGLKLKPTAF